MPQLVKAVNVTERSVKAEPAKVTVVAPATPTIVLPDLIQNFIPNQDDWGREIAGRYIFNDTGAKLYYAFGTNKCDNVATYHGAMADQQMLDCSNVGQEVCVYSVAGGNVATTILNRQDMAPHRGPIPANRDS